MAVDPILLVGAGILGLCVGSFLNVCILRLAKEDRKQRSLFHPPSTRVDTALPGGGGYGNPFERDPDAVVDDVLNGYVSIEAAAQQYGVVIRSSRRADEQISMPEHFALDLDATARMRSYLAREISASP